LGQALAKGDKMDLIVEKATELGVRRIVPFLSSYTVPKPDKQQMERRQARWSKISLSAAKQSGRTQIPEILGLCDFEALLREPWHCDLKLLLWEKESVCGLAEIRGERPELKSVLLAIGPEGGFSSEEAAKAKEHGFRSIRLGKRILRTETAALAALSLVQFLWGDLG
jgi:16S rRNA (uracil1498-N3)-methyltransferase